jgi:hypothetical protein
MYAIPATIVKIVSDIYNNIKLTLCCGLAAFAKITFVCL